MQDLRYSKKIIFTVGLLFLFSAGGVYAQNIGDAVNFYVESSLDASGRSRIEAVLVKTAPKLYFYAEKSLWDSKMQTKKDEILANLNALSSEFENNIYPKLTSVFGSEWKPGIDGDERITLLFHAMTSNEGGYFRTADEYEKLQLPNSNEREMLYLSIDLLTDKRLKIALAHEFVHLITFNQKNKIFGIEEEVWLNEARADFSSTILGYDDQYSQSNLQSRARDFIENPSDPITEWRGTKHDYAAATLFMNYLVDHFKINILADSLKSRYVGIESINYALNKAGYREEFPEIFTNWTIAVVLNDCSSGSKYCYFNSNLEDLRIAANINFLPLSGSASLSVSNVTKNWAGNWQKFIGGNGDFKLEFSSLSGLNFEVPYVLEDKNGRYSVKFLALNGSQKGEINIADFGTDYKSLIIIPSLQDKFSGFNGLELAYPFSYAVAVGNKASEEGQSLIQQLLERIESLKRQIAELRAKLVGNNSGQSYCSAISNNLYFRLSNNSEVRCLQDFLKSQGQNIYPEGLVTGYFGNLTRTAVVKFQEKYASEILTPLGLYAGTGFVGPSTRNKINQLLAGS